MSSPAISNDRAIGLGRCARPVELRDQTEPSTEDEFGFLKFNLVVRTD
jgi:hypothetical protein